MVEVQIFEASTKGYIESSVNKFLEEKAFEFSKGYKIHYTSTYSRDNVVNYSAMIEYDE